MARREWRLAKRCAHEGCDEVGRWTYSTRRDMESSFEARNVYRCIRHSRPDEVLGVDNRLIETVLVSEAGVAGKLFFGGRQGFVHGPGFKVFADDLPEGTRLVVTARIELPAQPPKGEGQG